ncbi:unnamed protein product [Somion occarium]|uniref:Uncharacterized protein n=1 Tax=Somion occarium TaxID=3059160 RepID=A0ABP1D4D8_9APHY
MRDNMRRREPWMVAQDSVSAMFMANQAYVINPSAMAICARMCRDDIRKDLEASIHDGLVTLEN